MPAPTTPHLTVDTIIELVDKPGNPIVLIKRKNPPYGWAIPGGFVDVGESVENAARREAMEETCLHVTLKTLLGVYSDPKRDPRGHTVGIVYIATARGIPQAADDAMEVQVVDIHSVNMGLAFDHETILNDYRNYLSCQKVTPLR